jgi:hypothetical protein
MSSVLPALASVVWAGNADFGRGGQGVDANSVTAPAWHRFMAGALDSTHSGDEWYDVPAGLTSSASGGQLGSVPWWSGLGGSRRASSPRFVDSATPTSTGLGRCEEEQSAYSGPFELLTLYLEDCMAHDLCRLILFSARGELFRAPGWWF